jgi:hypothetical protein
MQDGRPNVVVRIFSRVTQLSEATDPLFVAFGAICCIAFFGVFGVLYLYAGLRGPGMRTLFDLDGERTLPAAFSGGLPAAASVLAFTLAEYGGDAGIPRRFVTTFGFVLAFMALDEVLSLHERLELWTGIDWQILYMPVVAVAAIIWAGTLSWLWRLRSGGTPLLLGGAVLWLVSQVFEFVQWGGFRSDASGQRWAILPEELGEMFGSALFGLALLVALRQALRLRGTVRPAYRRAAGPHSPWDVAGG